MQTKILLYIVIGILVVAAVVGASYYYFAIKQPVEISPPPSPEVTAPPPEEIKPLLEELEAQNKSAAFIYLSETDKVKVFLYAPDEKIRLTSEKELSCLYPEAGLKVYRGNYQLVFDASTLEHSGSRNKLKVKDSILDIGEMEFVEHVVDPKIYVGATSDGLKNKIILYQYGGCIYRIAVVYGYDLNKMSLTQYKFKYKDGTITDELITGLGGIKRSSSTGNFISSAYSQETGKFEWREWQFDSDTGIFNEIKSWETEI